MNSYHFELTALVKTEVQISYFITCIFNLAIINALYKIFFGIKKGLVVRFESICASVLLLIAFNGTEMLGIEEIPQHWNKITTVYG